MKKELKKSKKKSKKLYIIHNLQTFTRIEQVEKYISEQLMHSATFQLKKRNLTKINDEEAINGEKKDNENNYFYEEIEREGEELSNNDFSVYHLIMANDLSESGKYYNKFTINFLRNQMSTCTNLK